MRQYVPFTILAGFAAALIAYGPQPANAQNTSNIISDPDKKPKLECTVGFLLAECNNSGGSSNDGYVDAVNPLPPDLSMMIGTLNANYQANGSDVIPTPVPPGVNDMPFIYAKAEVDSISGRYMIQLENGSGVIAIYRSDLVGRNDITDLALIREINGGIPSYDLPNKVIPAFKYYPDIGVAVFEIEKLEEARKDFGMYGKGENGIYERVGGNVVQMPPFQFTGVGSPATNPVVIVPGNSSADGSSRDFQVWDCAYNDGNDGFFYRSVRVHYDANGNAVSVETLQDNLFSKVWLAGCPAGPTVVEPGTSSIEPAPTEEPARDPPPWTPPPPPSETPAG